MGICFVMMAVIVVMAMLVFAFQDRDTLRCIDNRFVMENILHKVFKTCTGNYNVLRGFRGFDLADIERIVVETGNGLCDQSGYG